jgi:hypothetical protein
MHSNAINYLNHRKSNGQISKRTLEKRRKLMKTFHNASLNSRPYGYQQNALRIESLMKRKRSLELNSQRLIYEKERLQLEKRNLDLKLAANECEYERLIIEKRRIDLALHKYQSDQATGSSETNHQHLSDLEDHDDNHSFDEMSDIND